MSIDQLRLSRKKDKTRNARFNLTPTSKAMKIHVPDVRFFFFPCAFFNSFCQHKCNRLFLLLKSSCLGPCFKKIQKQMKDHLRLLLRATGGM